MRSDGVRLSIAWPEAVGDNKFEGRLCPGPASLLAIKHFGGYEILQIFVVAVDDGGFSAEFEVRSPFFE